MYAKPAEYRDRLAEMASGGSLLEHGIRDQVHIGLFYTPS